jgi:protein-S-isoprenylcysteine O-methyltransferase Ste14
MPQPQGMRAFLLDLTGWCGQFLGVFWVAAAAYFAIVRPGTVRQKLGYFARTFFPEPWLFLVIPVLFVLLALVPRATWRDLTVWNPVVAVVGAVLAVASVGLMCWARWSIGTMWAGRPLVQERHDLHTGGPYRIVRHPIYTGGVGVVSGAMLVAGFGEMTAVLLGTLAFVAWRVWAEERMMVAAFGDRYRGYRREVPALVPFLRAG